MKKGNKIGIAVLALGIGSGAALFTPMGSSAATNVVVASVDWVNSQLSPINTKVASLESKINSQQTEIDNLKAQLSSLGSNPPPTQGGTDPNNGGSTQLPSTVYVSKTSAAIHSGATKDYKVVATKTMGSSLKVIDSFKSGTGVWYRVELSADLKGWIFSGDVSATKPSSGTTTPSQVKTTGEVYLRAGATTSYEVYTTIPAGTTLKYIQSFKNGKGETWYNVETSAGLRGWIFSGLAEVQ